MGVRGEIVAHRDAFVKHRMGMERCVAAKGDVRPHHGERANGSSGANGGGGVDRGQGMDTGGELWRLIEEGEGSSEIVVGICRDNAHNAAVSERLGNEDRACSGLLYFGGILRIGQESELVGARTFEAGNTVDFHVPIRLEAAV